MIFATIYGMTVKVSLVYRQNLALDYQDVHMEDLEYSMLDESIVCQIITPAVILYDAPSNRAIILKHSPLRSSYPMPWSSLAGRLYSRLMDAINDVHQSYDPPALQPLAMVPV